MNFEEMTIEELNQIIAEATEARETLVLEAKNTAWEKVVKAIKDYVYEYGEIEIKIYGDANFGEIEVIRLDNE